MPKTLLLADDSVTIQKVVGITFANEDVEVVTENNGDDALRRARELKPDLVLADVGMPGLDGYELCAALRADPDLSHIPVLLLTGTFQPFDAARGGEVGASGHVSKPFEAQTLVDTVFAMLNGAAPSQPAAVQAKTEEFELPNSDFSGPSAATAVESAPAAPADDAFRFEDLDFAEPESNSKTDLFGEPPLPRPEPTAASDTPAPEAKAASGGETLFMDPMANADTAPDLPAAPPEVADEATVVAMPPEIGPEAAEPVADPLPEVPEAVFLDPAAAFSKAADVTQDAAPPLADAVPFLEEEPIALDEPMPSPAEPSGEPLEALLEEAEANERERTGKPRPAAAPTPEATALPAPAPPMALDPEPQPEPEMIAADPEPEIAAPVAADAGPEATDDAAPAPATSASVAPAPGAPAPGVVALDTDAVRQAVERVAWEALGDLSEQLVREVVAKVEAIAWEVVPEMAERILAEEIERLKRETD